MEVWRKTFDRMHDLADTPEYTWDSGHLAGYKPFSHWEHLEHGCSEGRETWADDDDWGGEVEEAAELSYQQLEETCWPGDLSWRSQWTHTWHGFPQHQVLGTAHDVFPLQENIFCSKNCQMWSDTWKEMSREETCSHLVNTNIVSKDWFSPTIKEKNYNLTQFFFSFSYLTFFNIWPLERVSSNELGQLMTLGGSVSFTWTLIVQLVN